MAYIPIKYTGNIFGIDEIDKGRIIKFIITFLIGSVLGYFLLNKSITIEIFADIIVGGVLAPSVYSIIKYYKDLIETTKKYLEFKPRTFFFILFEILLVSFLFFELKDLPSYLLIPLLVSWEFSGYLRIILTQTNALFDEDIKRLRNNFVIYGYSRLSYFIMIPLISLVLLKDITSILFFSTIYFPFIFLFYYLSMNVSSYAQRSPEVERNIKIIRYIKNYSPSREKIGENFEELGEQKINLILSKLHNLNFIKKEGRKYTMSPFYSF